MARKMKRGVKFGKLDALTTHVGSVAVAIEALESVLLKKGILVDNELMEAIQVLMKEKINGHSSEPGSDHGSGSECGTAGSQGGEDQVGQTEDQDGEARQEIGA